MTECDNPQDHKRAEILEEFSDWLDNYVVSFRVQYPYNRSEEFMGKYKAVLEIQEKLNRIREKIF